MNAEQAKRFALIGAAGYVAPRHLQAIQDTGHTLIAACDPHDSVGILDGYFPEAAFFTEFERFDRHLEKCKREGDPADFISVCSPNYLHDAHCRFGLRYGADVVCEKPLVLNPWNLDGLADIECETGRRIWNILQLRHHPKVLEIKQMVADAPPDKIFPITLTYITPRGKWYHAGWKGDPPKSGGIIANIGIHLFDMLMWVFGETLEAQLHIHTFGRAAGFLRLRRAEVRWFLSIEAETLPPNAKAGMAHRQMTYDNASWDFSEGFNHLHTAAYQAILAGKGWSLEDARSGVHLTHRLREMTPERQADTAHPLSLLPLSPHPFLR